MRILELSISGTVGTHEMGPVSSVVCDLANQFVAHGHEVCLVDARAAQPRSYLDPRIQVIDIDCAGAATLLCGGESFVKSQWLHWRNACKYLWRVSARLDLDSYDILHVHSHRLGYLTHRALGKSYVLTSHTPKMAKSNARRNPLRHLPSRVMGSLDRRAIEHARVTVALGSYLEERFPGASIATIPNGINLNKWAPVDKQSARRTLGIADEEFTIVFTGRISPVKGVDVLLDATEILARQIERLRVLVVGSLSGTFNGQHHVSAYAQRIAERARDLPVNVIGFVNNKEPVFKNYLAAADVAVVPSRQEPQGLVVLEALAMGTPVVASDTGGISAMVDSQVGCLVPPGDGASLAEKLLTLYRKPAMRLAMSGRCRSHVERSWAWPQIAQRYLETFAGCHKEGTPPGLLNRGELNYER